MHSKSLVILLIGITVRARVPSCSLARWNTMQTSKSEGEIRASADDCCDPYRVSLCLPLSVCLSLHCCGDLKFHFHSISLLILVSLMDGHIKARAWQVPNLPSPYQWHHWCRHLRLSSSHATSSVMTVKWKRKTGAGGRPWKASGISRRQIRIHPDWRCLHQNRK